MTLCFRGGTTLIRSVRKSAARLERELGFTWGRAWHLRARFLPVELCAEAHRFLTEHQNKLFFVMGSGRSGTQLITSLLDSSGATAAYHEPNFKEDVGTMDILRRDTALADRYWRDFRSVEVYRRWQRQAPGISYGEVNGTIRYQTPSIIKLYPEAGMLLMARDGRGVVRSVMGWPQFYGPDAHGAYALEPLPGDPFCEEWPRMTRFERVCWSWRDTNEFLMNCIPVNRRLQFERITSNYEYFAERFLGSIGLELSRDSWSRIVGQPSKNATANHGFPHWCHWGDAEQKAFWRICGDTMARLGYV